MRLLTLLSIFLLFNFVNCLKNSPTSTDNYKPELIEPAMIYDSIIYTDFKIPVLVKDKNIDDKIENIECQTSLNVSTNYYNDTPYVTFQINEGDTGDYSFPLIVFDKGGLSDTMTLTFTIRDTFISDFAPMKIGNTWEYYRINNVSGQLFSRLSIRVVKIDSIINDSSYISIKDSILDINNENSDTIFYELLEKKVVININENLIDTFPFYIHNKNINSLESNESGNQFTFCINSLSRYPYYDFDIYINDLGLVYSYFYDMSPGGSFDSRTVLSKYNGKSIDYSFIREINAYKDIKHKINF